MKQQQGAVMLLGLTLLVILTIIVGLAAKTSVLQQKMAGNFRDSELAFQAAETALKSAERYLQGNKQEELSEVFSNQNGLLLYEKNRAWEDNESWSDKSPIESEALHQVVNAPVYVIEELPNIEMAGDSLAMPRTITGVHYRITAKSTGGTRSAAVVLQSMYKK